MMTEADATTRRTLALERLAQAATGRAAATLAYRTALLHAASSGATYADIAKTLGIHRVSARQAVIRAQTPIQPH